jgi:hypothetical protein
MAFGVLYFAAIEFAYTTRHGPTTVGLVVMQLFSFDFL